MRIATASVAKKPKNGEQSQWNFLFAKAATLTSISRLFRICNLLWWSANQFSVRGAWNMTLSPRPWISLPAGALQIHYSCLRVTQSGQIRQQSATLTLPRRPDQDPLCNNACWPLTDTHTLLILQVPKGYKGRRILRWRLDFKHRAAFPRHEIRRGVIRLDCRIATFEVTVY